MDAGTAYYLQNSILCDIIFKQNKAHTVNNLVKVVHTAPGREEAFWSELMHLCNADDTRGNFLSNVARQLQAILRSMNYQVTGPMHYRSKASREKCVIRSQWKSAQVTLLK